MKNLYSILKLTAALVLILVPSVHAQIITYSFTSCGATASLGPTQAQINSAYTGTNPLTGSVVSNSGIQTFTYHSGRNR